MTSSSAVTPPTPAEALTRVFADVSGYDDLIVVRDVPFVSHCEHHMVPFIGRAHIAYYPSTEGVVGLSKLARLVDVFAKRLQTQEALTAQVLQALELNLRPRGCAVMIEAEHMCMSLRGVRKHGTSTVTLQFAGNFKTDPAEQVRFLSLLRSGPVAAEPVTSPDTHAREEGVWCSSRGSTATASSPASPSTMATAPS